MLSQLDRKVEHPDTPGMETRSSHTPLIDASRERLHAAQLARECERTRDATCRVANLLTAAIEATGDLHPSMTILEIHAAKQTPRLRNLLDDRRRTYQALAEADKRLDAARADLRRKNEIHAAERVIAGRSVR